MIEFGPHEYITPRMLLGEIVCSHRHLLSAEDDRIPVKGLIQQGR
jgi:hypothetical protein